jgi:hypothetical protein
MFPTSREADKYASKQAVWKRSGTGIVRVRAMGSPSTEKSGALDLFQVSPRELFP